MADLLGFLRGLMGAEATLVVMQVVMMILLGVLIAVVFLTVRDLVMYYALRGRKK
jgi:hypothetical protein